MTTKNFITNHKILTIVIILIFLVFTSYNISVWVVHKKYSKATALNEEITNLRQMVKNDTNKEDIINKIDEINEVMLFIGGVCLND